MFHPHLTYAGVIYHFKYLTNQCHKAETLRGVGVAAIVLRCLAGL